MPRPRIKLFRAIACLALGPCVSVAVAWALARWPAWKMSHLVDETAWVLPDGKTCIARRVFKQPGETNRYYSTTEGFEKSDGESTVVIYGQLPWKVSLSPGEPDGDAAFKIGSNNLSVCSFGLPFRCLQHREWHSFHGCFSSDIASANSVSIGETRYPAHPLALGLAGNTAAYGSALYAIAAFPGFLRKRRAAKAGLCSVCRYDLRGLPSNAPCPECGKSRPIGTGPQA